MDRDQARHAAAHFVLAAHEPSGTLRRAHPHIDVVGRNDRFEVDAEAVRKRQRRPGLEVLLDVALVRCGLLFVGDQHHGDVGALDGFADLRHFEAFALRLGTRLRITAQSDDNFAA